MKLHYFLVVGMAGLYGTAVHSAASGPDWLRLIKGAPMAQTEWAARYEHGEGVAQDYGRAMQLYCAAARRGHAPAQYQLGWMFANGRGVTRDDAQAAAWFRLAASKGDAPAQRMLARLGGLAKTKRAICAEPVDPTRRPPPPLQLAAVRRGPPSPKRAQVEAMVTRLAPNYGLQPSLVLAVIEAESGFNAQARSDKEAQGLMQLIPKTAQRFGVQDPYDPVQNLHGGMAYLRWLLAYFRGDVRLTLAGYNAGEGAVVRYGGVPPYAETRAYVEKITRAYGQLSHPPVAPVARPASLTRVPFAASALPVSPPLWASRWVDSTGNSGQNSVVRQFGGAAVVLPNPLSGPVAAPREALPQAVR